MKFSTFGHRIAGFARTALTAATRKSNRQSTIGNRQLPAPPLAMASIIRPQVRERWLLPQVGAITPQYIEMTLRGALAGAHLPQWELFNLMEDTWPRLRKNVLELKMAVRNRRPVFEAYRDEDEQESPAATERMKLVSAALRKMQPDPAADECAFDDMVGDILDAWFKGVSVLEIDWHLAQTRQLGRFVAPRCTRWASPVNYAWDENLRLGLAGGGAVAGVTDPSRSRTRGDVRGYATGVVDPGYSTLAAFPTDRVIVAKCKTKSGSILGGALLRPLVWWWCAANFSADWLLNLAQVFGLPFRWATYEPTAAQETVDRICAMLQNMGSAGWAAFPAGTSLELKAEGTKSGAQTPQGDMLDRADKQCDLLVLGQTLTTDTGGMGAGGGSRALGQVHADVRAGIIDAAAKFAASVIEQQLIPAILRLNYGDADEAPTLTFHERGDDDLGARAQWIATLTNAGAGRIIPLDWLAKTFGIPKPDAGEMTLGQAKQEEQQAKNENLAAHESHPSANDDALQAALWIENLHPRSRGGLFTFKPAVRTSTGPSPTPSLGSFIKKAPPLAEPKPTPPSKTLLSPPGSASNQPEPIKPRFSDPKPVSKSSQPQKNAEQILVELQPCMRHVEKLQQIEEDLAAATAKRLALKRDIPNYMSLYMRLNDHEISLRKRADKLRESVIVRGRKIVALPVAQRGSLPVIGDIPQELQKIVHRGREFVEMYVHPGLLPRTAFERIPPDVDPHNILDIAHVNEAHHPDMVAHEIAHNIESQHPAVLQKSRDFLTLRAQGEKPIKLKDSDLANRSKYGDDDYAIEDEWEGLAGRLYHGRFYVPPGKSDPQDAVATELLTDGLNRLHRNPALFAATDPEYFTFVVNTLRNL